MFYLGNEFLTYSNYLNDVLIKKHKLHVFTLSNHLKASIVEVGDHHTTFNLQSAFSGSIVLSKKKYNATSLKIRPNDG